MGLFKNKDSLHGSAHVKGHTVGTSNEVSFSVLDAAARQNAGDEGTPSKNAGKRGIGGLSLFTLSSKKPRVETPRKKAGLHLPSGGFVPVDEDAPTPLGMARDEGMSLGEANAAIHIESSDGSTVGGSAAKPARSWSARKGGRAAAGIGAAPESVGGAGGGAGSTTTAPRKKRGKTAIVAVSAAACVALIAVGAMFVLRDVDFAFVGSKPGTVQGSLAKIAKADKTLIEMDSILSEPIEPEDKDAISRILGDLPAAKKQLQSARTSVENLQDTIKVSADKDAAQNALDAIDARLQMLASGESLLRKAYSAVQTIDVAERAWAKLETADSAARKANEIISAKYTTEAINESMTKTDEAIADMKEALQLVESAAQLYSAVDFSATKNYLALRIDALQHAKASCQALLSDDTETAIAENTAYNDIDAQAAAIVKSLPEDVTSVIVGSYQEAAQEDIEAYSTARTRAGAVDANLRNYLKSLD